MKRETKKLVAGVAGFVLGATVVAVIAALVWWATASVAVTAFVAGTDIRVPYRFAKRYRAEVDHDCDRLDAYRKQLEALVK